MYFVFTEPHTVQDRKFGAIIYLVVQRLETFVWKCFDANCIGKFGPNLDFFMAWLCSNHGDLRNCLGIDILWCHQAWSMYSLIMHVKVCFVIAGTPITCLENIQCSEMSWNFGNSLVLFCRYCIQGFFCSVIFSPFNTFKHFAPSYIHQIKIRLCFCKNCSVWYCPLTMGAKGVKWSGGIFSLHTLVGPTLLWKF